MTVRALVIAIEDYPRAEGLSRKLEGTLAAGSDFVSWLRERKGVRPEHLYFCASAEEPGRTAGTTRADVLDALRALVDTGRDDTSELYVFFSGHGFSHAQGTVRRPADVLVTSEFTTPEDSGGACLRLRELQEKLQLALGPGEHYYFLDACRNVLPEDAIDPLGLGRRLGASLLGVGSLFTLYSTAPQSRASVDSGFARELLDGLHGGGRAKGWDGGRMFVTFDLLRRHVRARMPHQEADVRIEGSGDGRILELNPVPRSRCRVRVVNANARDTFTLTLRDSRGFTGAKEQLQGTHPIELKLPPDDYTLEVSHPTASVRRREPPGRGLVDLYDSRDVEFERAPVTEDWTALPPPPLPEPLAKLTHTNVSAHARTNEAAQAPGLPPGLAALADELLLPVEAQRPAQFLGVLGSAYLTAPERLPSPLRERESRLPSDEPGILVLALLGGPSSRLRASTGLPSRELHPMEGVAGVQACWLPNRAGSALLTLEDVSTEEPRPALTCVTHVLADRVTLLTVTNAEDGAGLEVHQYLLPPQARLHALPQELQRPYAAEVLRFTRALCELQQAFARRRVLAPGDDRMVRAYWQGAEQGTWLDPHLLLLRLYERVRREGAAGLGTGSGRAILDALQRHFPTLPDTRVLAALAGHEDTGPGSPPLFLDGLLLGNIPEESLPLPHSRLTYEGPWVTWSGAVRTTGTSRACEP
ncbi:caspase family protein [Myxococcaceae bacterium GXIMD 01537]